MRRVPPYLPLPQAATNERTTMPSGPGGPTPFLDPVPTPDTIWRCPHCGYLTSEEGSSTCDECLAENADEDGDTWQPYVPVGLMERVARAGEEAIEATSRYAKREIDWKTYHAARERFREEGAGLYAAPPSESDTEGMTP